MLDVIIAMSLERLVEYPVHRATEERTNHFIFHQLISKV